LFEIPLGSYLKMLPRLIKNAPVVMGRRLAREFMDLPPNIDLEKYPSYYRQNFHWQTDGYLSSSSAALYDVAVEMLFFGMADVMRRQVIPPITRFLREQGPRARALELGCGTGRTAAQIATAHPTLHLIGADLSPYYVEHARANAPRGPNVSFLEAN